MDQQTSITVFNTPSGMGGSYTVSILEDRGETALVRVWYGTATAKGWKSWRDWDGHQMEVSRTQLTNEREMKLVKTLKDDIIAQCWLTPFKSKDYQPGDVFRRYLEAYADSDYLRIVETNDRAGVIRIEKADATTLPEDQVKEAFKRSDQAFKGVLIWEREPGVTYPNAFGRRNGVPVLDTF
ncbi:hypothetical protein [Marinobacter salsuginis]|uniref:Uncharacterized protein n=1 Tax=Marinobacter salsuginis TaxID=418719 RepID=A0A5M3Q1Y3_9GAMM|nr:hypothetical protein [Marinobacter salsuginis]GBO89126.1 hypothetical protein MSSD14B_27940 [Marinobacter salsuginis]